MSEFESFEELINSIDVFSQSSVYIGLYQMIVYFYKKLTKIT